MLRVKVLAEGATVPTVGYAGEDLGYDVYALEDVVLIPGVTTRVRTGIAAEFDVRVPVPKRSAITDQVTVEMARVPYGFLIEDRGSMAEKGITVSGKVIDASYRGEIIVLLMGAVWLGTAPCRTSYPIKAGDKIAQMIPTAVLTRKGVEVVDELSEGARGTNGFGSTGV